MTDAPAVRGGPGFLRALGFGDLWAQVLNAIIGAGIFALPATAAALMGDRAILAYVGAAVVMGLVAVAFAELGSAYVRTGGAYLYAKDAFGSFAGFQVGWLMLLTRITAYAALLNALLDYVAYLWPPVAGSARLWTLGGLLAALAAINVRGVRWGANTTNLLTVAKVLPLVAFVAVGGALAFLRDLPPAPPVPAPDPLAATLILVFAFSGFEPVTVPAEEARHPGRDLPRALFAGLGVATLLYLAIQYVAARATPDLAASTAPLAEGADRLVGRWGALVMTAGAAVSILGTISGGVVLVPRLVYALAADRHFPAVLARIHPRFRTPDLSILLLCAVVFALAAVGGFGPLARLSTIARLLVYGTTCLAAVRLHRRLAPERAFHVTPALPALGAAACGVLLLDMTAAELWTAGGAIAAGSAVYLGARGAAARRAAVPPAR